MIKHNLKQTTFLLKKLFKSAEEMNSLGNSQFFLKIMTKIAVRNFLLIYKSVIEKYC